MNLLADECVVRLCQQCQNEERMPRSRKPQTECIYQMKVTLQNIRPPIWRRIQVPSDLTLRKFHRILQDAMGWYDSHLHQFTIRGVYYAERNPEWEGFGPPVRSERTTRLEDVVSGPKMKFVYEYDFGDGWEHEILVEKVLPPEEGVRYPVCVTGAPACPPEDCGGPWGYAELLEAIRDRNHERHEELLEWVGARFDPEAFDLAGINRALRTA